MKKKARTCPFSCEDILANILSGPKSLARLMCVSKVWPALIYDRIRPKPPDFRLLCRFRHEVKLLRIDENGDAAIEDDLSFIPNKPWLIVDSCSDMLLCSKKITNSQTVLSIWKPITKQWVDITEPRDWGFKIPYFSDLKFSKTELFALAAYDIRPKPPDFRLLCRFRHELKLLRIDENRDAAIEDDLSFIPNKPWLIVDSCSDMLLCSKKITHSRTVLSIWKPITKQWVDITEPCDWGFQIPDYSDLKFPKTELFALAAYDGCRFKVIRFIYAFGRTTLEMFSSDTGKWSECKAVVSAPSPRILCALISPSKSLFLKGALHLVCRNYILVYHIDTDLCSFIKLPSPMLYGKLWEARGRLICCVYVKNDVKNGFQIWDRKEDDQSSEWELKQDVDFAMLSQQYPEIFAGFNEWRKIWLIVPWPWAFNDDSQCLYLSLPPGRVASYNLETRTLKVIFSFPGKNLYPFEIFPLVRDDD